MFLPVKIQPSYTLYPHMFTGLLPVLLMNSFTIRNCSLILFSRSDYMYPGVLIPFEPLCDSVLSEEIHRLHPQGNVVSSSGSG